MDHEKQSQTRRVRLAEYPAGARIGGRGRCACGGAVRLLLSLFLILTNPAASAEDVIIYNWEAYLADEVLADFHAETGHTVRQDFFNDENVRDSVITSGRARGYDLILIEDNGVHIMARQGLLKNLNDLSAKLSSQLDPRWTAACGNYGVPYAWGTTGILYRSSVSPVRISSWKQLFDPPPEHSGGVVMLMDQVDTIATALLATGAAPDSADESELRRAFALLRGQRPHLLARGYGLSYALERGANSKMSMTLGYAGDLQPVREATGQTDWVYRVPTEGSMLWVDCLAAPANKPLSRATREFLSFINRPAVAARNAELAGFATPNRAALAVASEDYRKDPNLFPPESVMDRSVRIKRMDVESLRLRDRMLTLVF
jgi:spermidine/putrescine-binding protein